MTTPASTTTPTKLFYFFVAIFVISLLGFFPTYLVKFPRFEGLTYAHHFHGFIASTWLLLLICQAWLIRKKNYRLHRLTGKLSFVIMPLLILSLSMVAGASYSNNIKTTDRATALAAMANGIPEMFFLGLLFTLGMLYRRNSGYHLRFLTCTGLIMLGPGLGRFLIAFCHLPFQYAIPLLILSTTGVGIAWLAVDIRNRRSAFPMAVYVAIGVLAFLIQANKFSEPWQQFAGWWASHFYH